LAIIAGWQNAKPLEDDIDMVRVAGELGMRIIQLAYHYQNYIASGCGERNDYGLSRYGINVVREMNRQGITVDLSHVGHQSVMDAIEYSEAPVSFTHANPAALGIIPE
jgi:microsomal dipeptidase-like Zn-dependent dipeptidase